ncbi:MAG: DUF1559 domain-containing protein [Armatimonadetes bacterium]|nr:DUF1559 domain-containing protein [Armatimonadota bacterium]
MSDGGQRGSDVQWHLTLTGDEAQQGCVRLVAGESIQVPPGTQHGSLLRFAGKGEPGFGDGPRGDLVVEVRLDGFGPAAAHTAPMVSSGSRGTNGCLLVTLIGCACLIFMVPIVAAVTLPIFAKAREKARNAACQSNERMVSLAMLQYSQDWDDCLVPNQIESGSWGDLISPYVKYANAFRCPLAPYDQLPTYVYRAVPPRAVKLSALKEPQSQVMGLDGDAKGIAWRHLEGANAWFLDGHVKWVGKDTAGSQYAGLDRMGKHVGGGVGLKADGGAPKR